MHTESDFVELCQTEVDLVSALVDLLEQEQGALLQGDNTLLDTLTASKNDLLNTLSKQAAKRHAQLQALDLHTQPEVYGWLADKPTASVAWLKLEQRLQFAQSVNQLNAGLLDQRLSLVEETLEVLRAAATTTLSYDRAGQASEGLTGGRFLGSA